MFANELCADHPNHPMRPLDPWVPETLTVAHAQGAPTLRRRDDEPQVYECPVCRTQATEGE